MLNINPVHSILDTHSEQSLKLPIAARESQDAHGASKLESSAKSGAVTPQIVPKSAFCRRFPNAVALDKRVSPELLVCLAYRATYADQRKSFGLNERHLRKIVCGKGFGRNVIRRAISDGVRLGFLNRPHNSTLKRVHTNGRKAFAEAKDTLNLPECGTNGRIVRRSWFVRLVPPHGDSDARARSESNNLCSLSETAAVLFIRAKGKVHARELAQRFGWSRPTTAKVISALLGHGLLIKETGRNPDGTIKGVTYAVPHLSAARLAPAEIIASTIVKKPGDGQQGNGQRCNGETVNTRSISLDAPLTGKETITYSKRSGQHWDDSSLDFPHQKEGPSSKNVTGPTQTEIDAGFAEWWVHYPRKEDKVDAKKAYKAMVTGKHKDADCHATIPQLLAAIKAHKFPGNPKFIKLPATWLNKGSWMNGANDANDPNSIEARIEAALKGQIGKELVREKGAAEARSHLRSMLSSSAVGGQDAN